MGVGPISNPCMTVCGRSYNRKTMKIFAYEYFRYPAMDIHLCSGWIPPNHSRGSWGAGWSLWSLMISSCCCLKREAFCRSCQAISCCSLDIISACFCEEVPWGRKGWTPAACCPCSLRGIMEAGSCPEQGTREVATGWKLVKDILGESVNAVGAYTS